MKKLVALLFIGFVSSSYGPPNCTLFQGDCKKGCELAEKAIQHNQGTRRSQKYFDASIAACPTFDYSYYEKSVPYAKRGDIATWNDLIGKAIELDPEEHLATRGWYHFFFLNNYEAAIADIEKLDSIRDYDIGTTGDAIYHLNILKGICYYEIGQPQKALSILEDQINDSTHFVSLYDYLCLGVLYMKNEKNKAAIRAFEMQEVENDLADNRYYKALVYERMGMPEKAIAELETASRYYGGQKTMENGYRELPFEVYQIDIDNKLSELR